MLILGFDIGNTRTGMGIYSKTETEPLAYYSFPTRRNEKTGHLQKILKGFLRDFNTNKNCIATITGVIVSSVVPQLRPVYQRVSYKLFKTIPLEVGCNLKMDISLNYEDPSHLGADRIANAVAAFKELKSDCIIIDLGTAITFCVLHENGRFDGGIIAPGIGIAINAIESKTSQLPRVNFEKPINLVSKNTHDAITSGIFYGWISMVEGIVKKIHDFYNKEFLILLTGGFAPLIKDHLNFKTQIDPLLTMKGIKYLYDMNVI